MEVFHNSILPYSVVYFLKEEEEDEEEEEKKEEREKEEEKRRKLNADFERKLSYKTFQIS